VQITFGTDAKAFGAIARVVNIREFNDFVTMTGGTARYLEAEERMEINFQPGPKAVELQQGKSKSWGSRLDYDNQSGDARVVGPIEIERSGDKPLTGSAKDMIYNVDDEILRLFGEVKLLQDGRTSTAESAVVREKDRIAFLYGTKEKPVKSINKDGTVEGTRLQYNLDTGDVVVLEGVKGEFRDP
jgi:lipopolysaccharide export system protein LptA